ncbi:hypothetical protein L6452_29818 [Arctium lappa]|uniref:Uncharacterized protein n=1 Tax=Arctium lappa TaxID=4217 RepID=A0ACB8ZGJ1_ARCLA|nr:hypothetical protein L6452_29818 [Arctium lappa]
MDSRNHGFLALILLIISSILCLQSRGDGTGSVFFLDSSTQRYFQPRSSETLFGDWESLWQSQSLLLPEIGVAISVLLGFSPPLTLSPTSLKKEIILDEVLLPNPFDRPHAVFVLEINGVEDKGPGLGIDSDVFVSSLKSRVALGQNYADIQLSDEEKVSLVSLNEPLPSDMEFTDNILDDFASWLGGSYVRNLVKSLSGELTVPLANNVQLKLHMSKIADREFITSLISLIQNVERAVQMHRDFSGSTHSPAELVMGRFDGVKALKEQYGTNDLVQQGIELLVTSLSKIYDMLQTVYKGQIVGVVLFNGSPAKESGTMLTVTFTSQPARYWLEERNESPHDRMIAQVVLVQRTLAWITRSILIMATLLGIYFLVNMILTRDTLLYSHVKFD